MLIALLAFRNVLNNFLAILEYWHLLCVGWNYFDFNYFFLPSFWIIVINGDVPSRSASMFYKVNCFALKLPFCKLNIPSYILNEQFVAQLLALCVSVWEMKNYLGSRPGAVQCWQNLSIKCGLFWLQESREIWYIVSTCEWCNTCSLTHFWLNIGYYWVQING